MDAKSLFKAAMIRVWGEAAHGVSVTVDQDDTLTVLAVLRFDPFDVEARGRELVQTASHYTLSVSPMLLEQTGDLVQKVLLHEAIHIGYPKHDARFKRVAAEVGTFSTEHAMRTDGTYVVEHQARGKGTRYRSVHETKDRAEAFAFAKGKRAGEGRYRVMF